MTSFNHYALGAVASWLHTTVGGLRPLSPGYKTFLVQPRPGGTIKIASVHTITPYGRVSVSWRLEDQTLSVNIEVPPNTTAVVRLAGGEETVGSGFHVRTSEYTADRWPPDPYETAFTPRSVVDTLAS
jgi:alpha-L-rhamnosidase